MSVELKNTLVSIYNRIAPEIQMPGLTVEIEPDPETFPGINVTADNDRLFIVLALYSEDDDIDNHRWEYMDCLSGAIIQSDLTHNATSEEVLKFFKHTQETDDSVIKL